MDFSAFDKRITSRDFSKQQLKDAGIDMWLDQKVSYTGAQYTLLQFALDNNLAYFSVLKDCDWLYNNIDSTLLNVMNGGGFASAGGSMLDAMASVGYSVIRPGSTVALSRTEHMGYVKIYRAKRRDVPCGVLAFRLCRSAPALSIIPKWYGFPTAPKWYSFPMELPHITELQLEGNAIGPDYKVLAPHDYHVDTLQILTPDTISSLSRLAKRSLPVELRGDCLYIYYDISLFQSANSVRELLHDGRELYKEIDHQLRNYRDTHVEDTKRPKSEIARKGKTLGRPSALRTILAGIALAALLSVGLSLLYRLVNYLLSLVA